MSLKRIFILGLLAAALLLLAQSSIHLPASRAAVSIYASPIQAGCYRAEPDRCSIHLEPFTLNLATGSKLASFQLYATRTSTGAQGLLYDFRPDLSNPAPLSGSTYSPSPVAKDFAANCGDSYTLTLIGQDTLDPGPYVLGSTGLIACPVGEYHQYLPLIRR